LVVLAAVAETYLIHANGDQFQGNEKAQMLENVGIIKHLIRRAGPPLKYLVSEPSDENYIHNHMAAIQEAKLLGEDFILADLENLILDTEADVFLEILLNNIKNDVISYQCFIAKEKKNTYNKLVNDLKLAKTNYVGQCEKITNLENKLGLFMEEELTIDLEKHRLYEQLNSEKITPHFLKLALNSKKGARMGEICSDTGENFETNGLRKQYIKNFYADLYSLPREGGGGSPLKNFWGRKSVLTLLSPVQKFPNMTS